MKKLIILLFIPSFLFGQLKISTMPKEKKVIMSEKIITWETGAPKDSIPTLSQVDSCLSNFYSYSKNIYSQIFKSAGLIGFYSIDSTGKYEQISVTPSTTTILSNHDNTGYNWDDYKFSSVMTKSTGRAGQGTVTDTILFKKEINKTGLSFNDTLYFSSLNRVYLPHSVTSDITIKIKSTGKISGATELIRFIGDGTHTITFTNCIQSGNSFDKTINKVNLVVFIFDGSEVWYNLIVKP